MAKKNDFSKGKISTIIMNLAVPLTVAQLINVLYNIVDRIFIGHMPENATLAMAGIGLCLPFTIMVAAFTNLFGMGGSPLCSMARGEGNEKKAEEIMGTSFSCMILIGVLITVIGILFKKPLLYAFGASDATYPFAAKYVTVYLLGSIFVMISLGMNYFINSQGFAKIGMLTVTIGAITNIILDPIFIYVLNLGVTGAALATIIAQGVSSVWVLLFLTGNQAILRLTFDSIKIRTKYIKRIVTLGLSGFIAQFTNSLVSIVCNHCLSQYGGDLYVSAMTILSSVREIYNMPIQGITGASQPVLGYNYGAKEYKRVYDGIVFTTVLTVGFSLIYWLLITVFPTYFVKFFNSDPELLSVGVKSLRIYFFGIFMMAFQSCGQSCAVGLGRSKQAVFFSLLRKVVIVVPLTLLLPKMGFGINGVFLAEPISNFIGGGACYITMWFTIVKELKTKMKENG